MIYSLSMTHTICDTFTCRSPHFELTPKFNKRLCMALGELLHPDTMMVTVGVMVMEREWGRVVTMLMVGVVVMERGGAGW